MKPLAIFNSLAFLYAARSFPRCLADSAERSLSMNTDEKRELSISFFLLTQTQLLSILETNRTKIGRGRGGLDAPSLDSVETSLLIALFEEDVLIGLPVRCIAWNIIFPGSAPSSDKTSNMLYANTPRCSLQNFPECCRNEDFLA